MVSDGFDGTEWLYTSTIYMHLVGIPWYMSKNHDVAMVHVQNCISIKTMMQFFLTKPIESFTVHGNGSLPGAKLVFAERQMHIPVPFSHYTLKGHTESSECLGMAKLVGFCCRAYLYWAIRASYESQRHVENKAWHRTQYLTWVCFLGSVGFRISP